MNNDKPIFKNVFAFIFVILFTSCQIKSKSESVPSFEETRVEIESDGWKLIGDLLIPSDKDSLPIVLMLNKAMGDRKVYKELANELAKKGIASLRVDLRGHGESINLGEFVPGEIPLNPLIWDSEQDVISLHKYLENHSLINSDRIAILGSSYSGEEMAEAGRIYKFANAYVALSPGSFSEESIDGIDASNVPWLFIAANDEKYLQDITTDVYEKSKSVELIVLPGSKHASNLLIDNKNLTERIAVWLDYKLK